MQLKRGLTQQVASLTMSGAGNTKPRNHEKHPFTCWHASSMQPKGSSCFRGFVAPLATRRRACVPARRAVESVAIEALLRHEEGVSGKRQVLFRSRALPVRLAHAGQGGL